MLSVKADSRVQALQPPPRSKYYFHIASEVTVHTDDSGVVLNDLAAHRYAVSAIWNYIRFDTEEQDWKGWHVKIADEIGRTLVIVLFPTAWANGRHLSEAYRGG